MVTFHSYVSLPEGTSLDQSWHLSINTGAHTAQAWSRLAAWRPASRPAETLISWTIVQPSWRQIHQQFGEYSHQNPPEFEAWIDISSIFLTCLSHAVPRGTLLPFFRLFCMALVHSDASSSILMAVYSWGATPSPSARSWSMHASRIRWINLTRKHRELMKTLEMSIEMASELNHFNWW